MKQQQGFTLVEIAIVLVIIGLLIGGLLKGQELIASAKVRNTISQMEELKTAVFAFQDRFKAMPGDMANANALVGAAAVNCTWACGNGLIQPWRNTSLVTNHLSAAGFYGGNTNTAESNAAPTAQNAPANPFGGPMFVAYWNQYNATAGGQPSVHGVYTGAPFRPRCWPRLTARSTTACRRPAPFARPGRPLPPPAVWRVTPG